MKEPYIHPNGAGSNIVLCGLANRFLFRDGEKGMLRNFCWTGSSKQRRSGMILSQFNCRGGGNILKRGMTANVFVTFMV